ncbi:unnamed protein product [Rhizophagus irregularis]|nr:unnamed protein product [Rhizophagus irregularis]
MIFNYSPNIKKLIIFSNYFDQELCNIPESRKCFLNVTTLKCYTFVKLDKLAQICHNIRYLNIKYCNYDNNPGLITLIKAQKNLKYFKCGFKAFSDPYEISCKGIGEALTKQADSILLIHLSCPIKFCCPIFTKFVNLKTLKIDGKIVDKSLMKPNLPNLEYLELYGGYIYEAAIFIKSTKGNLREIRIKHDFHEKNRLMFIQSITQYCPNLKSVALFYQDDHLVIRELEKLFSTCSQLERLVIVCEDYYNDSYDKLLDILVINAPSSLNSLKLDNFKIKMKSLKTFFKRWKEKHQTSISVYYILYFKEIHKVDIINDCIEVKKFDDNYCCRYFDWNYDYWCY